VRGFSEARPEFVRAARVSVSRSARAAAFGFASDLRVTAGSSSATDASSSRPIVVDSVASGCATSRAAMRTLGPPPIKRTTAAAHPKKVETPHTSRAARMAERVRREGRTTNDPCRPSCFKRPSFPREDQHGVNRGGSWPVDESCPYGVAHLGRALLGFGFASSGS
jgi:hypothetical protein